MNLNTIQNGCYFLILLVVLVFTNFVMNLSLTYISLLNYIHKQIFFLLIDIIKQLYSLSTILTRKLARYSITSLYYLIKRMFPFKPTFGRSLRILDILVKCPRNALTWYSCCRSDNTCAYVLLGDISVAFFRVVEWTDAGLAKMRLVWWNVTCNFNTFFNEVIMFV